MFSQFFNADDLQDRLVISFASILLVGVLQIILSGMSTRFSSLRPAYESMLDALFSPIVAKLNRRFRSSTALFLRGVVVLSVMLCLILPISFLTKYASRFDLFSPIYVDIFMLSLFLSVSAPLIFCVKIAKATHNDQFLKLSRASYSNLVHHDDHGILRHSIKYLVLSFGFHLILPVFVYIFFGLSAVIVFASCVALVNIAGRLEYGGSFSVSARLILAPFAYVAQHIAAGFIYVSSFFSSGASMLKSFFFFFKELRMKNNPIWEGGASLNMMALLLEASLGGPYQDRYGQGVSAPWVGDSKSSAQIKSQHALRAAYAGAIAIFLLLVTLVFAYLLIDRLAS